jgi:Putative Flp pilus-assembly TadE/G-like
VSAPVSSPRGGEETGTITLWLVGCATMLLVLGGLGVDLGRGFSERRALSAAADAAALAGAGAIDEAVYRDSGRLVLVPARAEARARADLHRQLDVAALRTIQVTADEHEVEVVVGGEVDLSILRLLDRGTLVVRVRATAVPRRSA